MNSKTQYFFEIEFGSSGVYELGTLSGITLPLTVTFTDAVLPASLAATEGLASDSDNDSVQQDRAVIHQDLNLTG